MDRDEERQNALARVVQSARLLHELRGLAGEVEDLLAGAMSTAVAVGLTKAVIAEAVALTPGRVSQIVRGRPAASADEVGDRVLRMTECPADALARHAPTFTGGMARPPYSRRRPRQLASR